MRPAEADGLIPEFHVDVERVRGRNGGDEVADAATRITEVWVIGSVPIDGDVRCGGGFLEARGQKTVVLEVANCL